MTVRVVYYVRTANLEPEDGDYEKLDEAITMNLANTVQAWAPEAEILSIGRNYYHDDNPACRNHGCTSLECDAEMICQCSGAEFDHARGETFCKFYADGRYKGFTYVGTGYEPAPAPDLPAISFAVWWNTPLPFPPSALAGEMTMREYLEIAYRAGWKAASEKN